MATLVLAVGMRRSGTTWLYNVLRYAFLNAEMSTYAAFVSDYREWTNADAHVVKTHLFDPDLCARADYVFSAYRDVRDIAASMVRRRLTPNTPDALSKTIGEMLADQYLPWSEHSDLEIRYEEMVEDRPAAIARILATLGLTDVNPEEVARDVEKLTRIAVPEVDRTTQLWPGHITHGQPGGYALTLSPESVAAIEAVARPWLLSKGYV